MSHHNTLSTPQYCCVSGGLNGESVKTGRFSFKPLLMNFLESNSYQSTFRQIRSEIGPLLGAIYQNQLPQRVQDDLAAVEAADALIVGTPVYVPHLQVYSNIF